MGFKVTIGGYDFEAEDYTVTEEATPLAAGDSQGSTGTISLTLQPNDAYAFAVVPSSNQDVYGDRTFADGVYGFTSGEAVPQRPLNTGWGKVFEFGPTWFVDKDVRLKDSRKGFTLGTVLSASRNDSGGKVTLSCSTKLYDLNVYGIQAAPFVGTLGNAFAYYLGLANYSGDFKVDDTIASRPVVFPGWSGELWFHLKEMAIAQECDISLVSGIILLRPIRTRVASKGRDIDRSFEVGGGTLAQAVEVYRYDSQPIANKLVWPPGGWKPETEVQNVNAGEEAEYVLELSSSVSSIQQPQLVNFVGEFDTNTSVYTIIANDGLPISRAAWEGNGGSLVVSIEPDTTSLRVKLKGPTGLPTTSGTAATNFAVALASDATGNRYSTLRILGSGVAFNKEKITIKTTVPASKTATEVGVTIDNPFINTVNEAYRAGTRAAKAFSGYSPTLSGSVTAINKRGDTGRESLSFYEDVQSILLAQIPSATYGSVQSYIVDTLGSYTYERDFNYWFLAVRDSPLNQVFGNVQGCRIYDKKSRRWYRIRSGTLNPPVIQQFQADDDLTFFDAQEEYGDLTYGQVQAPRSDWSYKQSQMMGLYVG